MVTKFKFKNSAWEYNNKRLTNQIFKLLPMFEQDEDWQKQQETIVLELKGYNDILDTNADFMILVGKLGALSYAENQFVFRKIVFEAITALKEIQV